MTRLLSALRRRRQADERGVTVVEVMVASAILMIALVAFFSGLASLQRTSQYEAGRNRALDDLRITAGSFAKDARHAIRVKTAQENLVVMDTYVSGSVQEVRWKVVTNAGVTNLEREAAGGSRLFVIRLTDSTIFTFGGVTDPKFVRRVGIDMETRPTEGFPPVRLQTEVSLRNVTLS